MSGDNQNEWIITSPDNPEFYPEYSTLGLTLWHKMKNMGNAIAQINGDTGKSDTYEELLSRSVRTALALQARGITSADIISMCSNNHCDAWTPLLAALFLNIRLSPIDPNLLQDAASDALNLIKPRIMFCTKESENVLETIIQNLSLNCEIVVFGHSDKHTSFNEFLKENSEEKNFEPKQADMMSTALLYFSGSTIGKAKPVCLNNSSLIYHVKYFTKVRNTKVFLFNTHPYWTLNMVFKAATILGGGFNIYCKKFNENTALKLIEKYQVTITFLDALSVHAFNSIANWEAIDTSSLKNILLGGSAFSDYELNKFRNNFPNTIVQISYGMTETICDSLCFYEKNDIDLIKSKPNSCGKVVPGFSIKIVDLKTREIVGPNHKGELLIKTRWMMDGYYKSPEETKASYDENGYFKTGDIAYFDEDFCFYVVDRIKGVFKFKCFRVVPAELEDVLIKHPDISEVIVVGLPDKFEEIPTAVVVLKSGATATEQDIIKFFNDYTKNKCELEGGVIFVENICKMTSGLYDRFKMRTIIMNEKKIE